MLPQGSPISIRVVKGSWGLLSSHCRANRPQLDLCPKTTCYSPVMSGISGLHSRFTWGGRLCLKLKQITLLSSRVATVLSWSPLSGLKGVTSCGVLRWDSGLLSNSCRKRRASSRDNGRISWFFSSCVALCGVSLELWWGNQGASRVAQGSPVSIRVARGRVALLSSHGWGIGPQEALKGEFRGLFRVAAGNPGFPRLVKVTSVSFSCCLWEVRYTVELRGASQDTTGVGAIEEGLISG